MMDFKRRGFLAATAAGLGLDGVLGSLNPLSADEIRLGDGSVRFTADIDPLVRFLEDTPRERVIEETARRVKAGLSYRELLAALLLAGVRNVQPRPSVGFKFHAVLVVNSAHLASVSGVDEERWLPIFWAIDNFKSSQARDVKEGNWTMAAVDESRLPAGHLAEKQLRRALDEWDESAADAAVIAMVRNAGGNRVYETLAKYAARDFRSIGHKVIYLSNAFRTLQTIGWEYAEPVMRSLVYAMLNHNGEPNPAQSDLSADRSGRANRKLASELAPRLQAGKIDESATRDLVRALHSASPDESSSMIIEMMQRGVAVQSIWDGLFCSAGELLMRQPGIVALHSVTTTNAIRHAFNKSGDQETRAFLLLQNASFLPMFRKAAQDRGKLADRRIDELAGSELVNAESKSLSTVPEVFQLMGKSRSEASEGLYRFLSAGGDAQSVVDHARRLVFLKGNDSHDYKFSSAALEDYRGLTPQWRNRFLAASMFQLNSPTDRTRPLVKRIHDAIG
ncbi:hypothetical protein [Planctomycetes bacterium K23_9]|uniref:Uncharacterized protein n=1 Tax=Stieleria marina TaxID=1930275 RepID=A0A517NRC4_9BACT|nr:hypothetical protein K239x_16030 [Planctomycetes bacterium K23_9]